MPDELRSALEVLKRKGIILYPTDTVWGIGCDATDEAAVDRIYAIKKRPDKKSMIILVDHQDRLYQYMDQVPEMALNLIRITDKPLTIIYPGARNIAQNLFGDDGSLGIRVVRDPFCKSLIEKLEKPIVSTSANFSGMPWPANFGSIDPEIVNAMDYVVAGRRHETVTGRPSGIIKIGLNGEVQVIRE